MHRLKTLEIVGKLQMKLRPTSRSFYLLPCLYLCAAGLLLSSWGCATPQSARVALVVGNGDYLHTTPLKSPSQDARVMGEQLEATGWRVTTAIDRPVDELNQALTSFEKEASNADQVIFFYAGHAMQIDGENYMVPVGFEPRTAAIDTGLVSLNQAVESLRSGGAQLAILVDACRENPLTAEFERASVRESSRPAEGKVRTRLRFEPGLAELPGGLDTFVAFATAPGHVAFDGTRDHSPFTRALLSHIAVPGEDIRTVFQKVRRDVVEYTKGSQVPWDYSSLSAGFWINSAPTPADGQ
ncbi:MAG: putative caspase-like protein [Myxococcota bacterium]